MRCRCYSILAIEKKMVSDQRISVHLNQRPVCSTYVKCDDSVYDHGVGGGVLGWSVRGVWCWAMCKRRMEGVRSTFALGVLYKRSTSVAMMLLLCSCDDLGLEEERSTSEMMVEVVCSRLVLRLLHERPIAIGS